MRLVRHRPGPFFFEPTIFFRSTNGGLEEALDVVIRSDGTPADGAKITVNGNSFSLNLDPHTSWGEQKQRIYLPAFERRRTLQPNRQSRARPGEAARLRRAANAALGM